MPVGRVGARDVVRVRCEAMSESERIAATLRAAGFTRRGDRFVATIDDLEVEAALGDVNVSGQVQRMWWTVEVELDASASIESLVPLILRRERSLDLLGKRVGVNREVQLGDPAFDAAVYLECEESPARIAELLGPEARRATTALLEVGAHAIALRPDTGRVTAIRESAMSSLGPDDMRAIACALVALRRALPGIRRLAARPRGPDRFQIVGLVLFLVAAVGAVAIARINDRSALWTSTTRGSTLAVVTAGLLVSFTVALVAARGSSQGWRRFGLVGIPAALAWTCWTIVLAAQLG